MTTLRVSRLISLVLGCALSLSAAAGHAGNLRVTSSPPGARILINHEPAGVTPDDVEILGAVNIVDLELQKEGFVPAHRRIDLADAPETVDISLSVERAQIPVTSAADIPPASDGMITLREAIQYANGDVRPVGLDRALITGDPGAGHPDEIIIAVGGQGPSPVLNISALLPTLADPGDTLTGPPGLAAVSPQPGAGFRRTGLRLGPGTEAANLILDGFDTGLLAQGPGEMLARDVIAQGGFVGFVAADGAELTLSGAQAGANELADVLPVDAGLIDGLVDPLPDVPDGRATLLSGPPGEFGHVILEGRFAPDVRSRLFVRHEKPRPLWQVEGLRAEATSYYAYRPAFGAVEAYQDFPRYAVDGREDSAFHWEFRRPAAEESLTIRSDRPLRTERIVIHHAETENGLKSYVFSLLDSEGLPIWEKPVEVSGGGDRIDIDPMLDFFGFKIHSLVTQSTGPGITEIEAMVYDSTAFAPRSTSRRRIVFPRPEAGQSGAILLDGQLFEIGNDLFNDVSELVLGQMPPLPKGRPEFVRLPENATAADFTAALDVLDPARPATIEIPGVLDARDGLTISGRASLRITGGGTIRTDPTEPFVLRSVRDILFRDMTLQGGLRIEHSSGVVLDQVSVADFQTGIEAIDSDVLVTRSIVSRGRVGLASSGQPLTVVNSTIDDVDVGVSALDTAPVTLIENRIRGRERALLIEHGDSSLAGEDVILLGNVGRPMAAPSDEMPGKFAALSIHSLEADNDPPYLGVDRGAFHIRKQSKWTGGGKSDLRTGRFQTRVLVIDLSDVDAAGIHCGIFADRSEAREMHPIILPRGAAVVMYDSALQILCANDMSGARLKVVPAAAAPGELDVPGAAHLHLSMEPAFSAEEGQPVVAGRLVPDVRAIGAGLPFQSVRDDSDIEAAARRIRAVLELKAFELATRRAFEAHRAFPYAPDISALLVTATKKWVGQMIAAKAYDAARETVEDLASASSDTRMGELAVATLARIGDDLGEEGRWDDALTYYHAAFARDPAADALKRRVKQAYFKIAGNILSKGTPDDLADWLDQQVSGDESRAALAREAVDAALSNAVVDRIKDGETMLALELADVNFMIAPSKRTRGNLRAAFSEFAKARLKEGEFGLLEDAFTDLQARHGEGLGLDDVMIATLAGEMEGAIAQQNEDKARVLASLAYRASRSDKAMQLIGYAYLNLSQRLVDEGNVAEAFEMLLTASQEYPEATELRTAARSVANNAAVRLYRTGDAAAAAAILEQAIEGFGEDGTLMKNLRVITINRAVDAANSGRLQEAREVAETGLLRFPGDPELEKVLRYVKRHQ